jgi:hypothetical protein
VDEGTTGDRVEVRVYFRQDGWVAEHVESGPYRDTADAAAAVEACVSATMPRRLAVLAEAVKNAAQDEQCQEGTDEARLVDALWEAAEAYVRYWRAFDVPAKSPEG